MKNEKSEELFSIEFLLKSIYEKWYWVMLSIAICAMTAYLYVRYHPKSYKMTAKVLIENDEFGDFNTGEKIIQELGYFSSKKNLYTELEVLKAYSTIKETIRKLPFFVTYYSEGEVRTTEIYYKNAPFQIVLDTGHVQLLNTYFQVSKNSDGTFKIVNNCNNCLANFVSDDDDGDIVSEKIEINVRSGDYVSKLDRYRFKFITSENVIFDGGNIYTFKIGSLENTIQNIKAKFSVSQPEEFASVIDINYTGELREKGVEFLNHLASDYVHFDLKIKDLMAKNTMSFIDRQLDSIRGTLNFASDQLLSFRTKNGILDFKYSSESVYKEMESLNREKAQFMFNYKFYEQIYNYVNDKSNETKMLSPSLVGINDPYLLNLLREMESLFTQREELKFGVKEDNPTVTMVEQKILSLRKNVIENVENLMKVSKLQIQDLDIRLDQILLKLKRLPKTERDLVKIEREFNLNEEIYTYLLKKKASVGIAKAGYKADNQILETARVSAAILVAPKSMLIFVAGIILGILMPIMIILLGLKFRVKIKSVEDIENKLIPPLLGIIGHNRAEKQLLNESEISPITDSFRIVRLKLQDLIHKEGTSVIGITSTISGEGKTYCALGLAASFASLGKRTLIVGGDLRKPRLGDTLDLLNKLGLSDYLVGAVALNEVIQSTGKKNLDILTSGTIPPNPAELLESNEFKRFVEKVKHNYELIIMDSSPIGLVSDFYTISNYTDYNLFIIRHNFTKFASLKFLNGLIQQVPKMGCVYNDNKNSKSHYFGYGNGYGYGYGYGYKNENKSIIKKIKKFWPINQG